MLRCKIERSIDSLADEKTSRSSRPMAYASCQQHCWPEAPHLMTPASLRPGPPSSATAGRPAQVVSSDRKPFAKARGAGPGRLRSEAMAGLAATVSQRAPGANTSAVVASVAPPCSMLSVLSSKTPASLLGPADASVAKKRASTRPYNEFCQELRPLLPARLRNAEREKLLGAAWKALSDNERHQFTAAGTPMPLVPSGRKRKGRHGGIRVARARVHAPTHASELQLLLAAPLAPHLQLAAPLASPHQLAALSRAPQLQLAAPAPPPHQLSAPPAPGPAPQLQLTMAPPQLQLTMAPAQLTMAQLTAVPAVIAPSQWFTSPPCSPPAPTAAPALWATRMLAMEAPIGVPMGTPGPLLDLRLPPLPPSLQRLHEMYPALMPGCRAPFPMLAAPPPPPPPPRAPALLTAASAHRTFVEHFLRENQQQLARTQQHLARVAELTTLDLAEIMEQQMTGEDAMEIAFSLGMPRI